VNAPDAPDQTALAETFTLVIDDKYTEWDFAEDIRQFVVPAQVSEE